MGDDSDGIITLGIGILIGTLFAYLIMKTRQQSAPATPTMQVMYIPYPPPVPSVQPAAAPPVTEMVKVQAAEPVLPVLPVLPVPPPLPVAKDEKTLGISKDNKGKLVLTADDRKVAARA